MQKNIYRGGLNNDQQRQKDSESREMSVGFRCYSTFIPCVNLQDFVTDSINKLMASEYPEEDWIWEYPDPVSRLGKREDVCIILFGSNGFRKAKVVFSRYSATALEFPVDTVDEPTESDSPSQAQSASTVVTDYGLIAFEWTEAHRTERNGRCSDVAGEESACRERRRPCGLSEVPGSGRTGRVPDRLCGAEDRGRGHRPL